MLSRSFENTVICILISIRLGIVQTTNCNTQIREENLTHPISNKDLDQQHHPAPNPWWRLRCCRFCSLAWVDQFLIALIIEFSSWPVQSSQAKHIQTCWKYMLLLFRCGTIMLALLKLGNLWEAKPKQWKISWTMCLAKFWNLSWSMLWKSGTRTRHGVLGKQKMAHWLPVSQHYIYETFVLKGPFMFLPKPWRTL